MLGLIRGRVYYNLLNWYRVLALLPGYTVNRRFMEQMMGVQRGACPDDAVDRGAQPGRGDALAGALPAAPRRSARLACVIATLPRRIARFYARLDAALGDGRPDSRGAAADELAAHYRELERHLLTRWDAPLVNDFFDDDLLRPAAAAVRALVRRRDGSSANDCSAARAAW